ncbi:uncharacterized protein [Mytilus edulis]|uniref:uncharacterized protein isoform X2 n=1 Tax=Mytilus edulis TaxID=6550 RepID=UPI0039EF16A8
MKDSVNIAVALLFLRFYSGDTVVMVTDHGTDATMPCNTKSGIFQWTMLIGDSYQNLQSSSKYSFSGKNLTIRNLNQDDSGFYQCVIFRSDGSESGRETPIELVVTVNGGWSTWSYSDICTVTCGIGTRTKTRTCNNPPPPGNGSNCQGFSSQLEICNFFPCLESGENNSVQPLVIATVTGGITIVLAILPLVLYAKRRWCKSKRELDNENTDITRDKSHTYDETHVNPMYQNDQQGAEVEVTVTENTYFDEANLVERYDVSDLTKQFRNKDYLLQKLRAEFKLLSNSTGDPKLYNSEYEIVDTRRNKEENKLYLKGSTLDVLHNNNVSVLLEIPQNSLAEQFWTLIDDNSIENIILLVKENEKVSEFYPTFDDIFKMNNFEISLGSAEKTHKIIMMLTFNLQNKTKETIRNVKIYKTNVSDVPTVQAMCYILDKASKMREAPVMIMNSKMADLSVCGVLTVCLNVMFAIKNQSPFSVLENAMSLYKQDRRFFKNVDDYELCYKVIGNYLEAVNTYDCID